MNLTDPNYEAKLARFPNHKQWTTGITNDGRVYIQDDNFEYDARLYINGDFPDTESQQNYAQAIADVLNGTVSRLPFGTCDCGCNIPVADNPEDMLRFLAGRFEYAGVADAVARYYARDIRYVIEKHYDKKD